MANPNPVDNRKPRGKWNDEFLVLAYRMARNGDSDRRIAGAMGIDAITFRRWVERRKPLASALAEGRKGIQNRGKAYSTFRDFVHGRLPKEVQEFWERLEAVDRDKESGWAGRRESILQEFGGLALRMRMHLFLHALVHSNFLVPMACRLLGLSRMEVQRWERKHPEFRRLLEGIHEHKKDFFESCLINLCRAGDTTAIIFANKTINRDRGYHDKVVLDVNHNATLRHEVKVEELPLDVQRGLLEALRRKKEMALLEDRSNVVEAEFTEKEEAVA